MSSAPTPGPETGVLGGLSPDVVLDAVIEASDDAIFTCGTGGSITTWGSTASRVFGREGADAVGMHLSALFADHLRDGVSALSRRVATGDVIRHFETEVLRGDGMPIPISLSVRPVHDRDGYVVGSVVVARDITEQRLAQAALAEVEARLAEGEALAGTGSWMWDVRTGAVQWSAEFFRIHGVDPLDFGGTLSSYLAAVHPEDRERLRELMESSVAEDRPFECRYRLNGAARQVLVRAMPMSGSAGSVVGLRGIGLDASVG